MGVSKLMGNLGFPRRKLMGKLSSNYVRNRQEIKQRGFVLQASHESLGKLQNERKGKGKAREILWAREKHEQGVWGALHA